VRFLSVSNASFTFRKRRRSLSVACLRLSGVDVFFLHILHAHVKHLRPLEFAVHMGGPPDVVNDDDEDDDDADEEDDEDEPDNEP
jgi:hypothetical protein